MADADKSDADVLAVLSVEDYTLDASPIDLVPIGTSEAQSLEATVSSAESQTVSLIEWASRLDDTIASADVLALEMVEFVPPTQEPDEGPNPLPGVANAVYVEGTDRTASVLYEAGISVERTLNERSRARVSFKPGFMPDRLDRIVIYREDGVTMLFGGLVLQRYADGRYEQDASTVTTCECADFSVYLDWYYISLSYAAETTLQTVLADIVAALPSGYLFSLDDTRDYSGITLAPFTWQDMRVSDAMRELATRTDRSWGVTPLRVLEMPPIPNGTAPESFTDGDPNCLSLAWEDPSDVPANAVNVTCGPSGTLERTQVWTCTGGETSWVCDIASAVPGFWRLVLVTPPVGTPYWGTIGDGAMFTFTATTSTLVSNIGAMAAGTVLTFTYVAAYPFTVTLPDPLPATPIIYRAEDEALTEYEQGVELATTLLARVGALPRTVRATSVVNGWAPGQSLTVNLTGRAYDAAALVKTVRADLYPNQRWRYQVDADESNVYGGSYQGQWRALTGGTSSGVALGTGGQDTSYTEANYFDVQRYGATGDGTTDDTAVIQAVFDLVPATGATVYFPAGTYRLTGSGLSLRDCSNVVICGAGMGLSVLDGSEATTAQTLTPFYRAVLEVGDPTATPATLNHLHIRDLSICGSGTSATDKLLYFAGVNQVLVERVEFYNGFGEVLYTDTAAFSGLMVHDCYFHDCVGQYAHCVNTNLLTATDLLVEGCRFERVSVGPFLLGRNIRVTGNTFVDVTNVGIYIGESSLRAWGSLSSVAVTSNTFTGLGKVVTGGYAFTSAIGIYINSQSYAYTIDSTHPIGNDCSTVVSSNTFLDGWDDKPMVCIMVQGGVLVADNYAMGVQTLASRSYFSEFIRVAFSADDTNATDRAKGKNSTPVYCYLRDNVLEKRPSGNNIRTGIYAKCTQNAYLSLSGNAIEGEWFGAVCYDDLNGGYDITVTMDGDRVVPYCYWGHEATVWGDNYRGVDIGMGSTWLPVHGSTATGFTTVHGTIPGTNNVLLGGGNPTITGSKNVYVGLLAGDESTTGDYNTAVGYAALQTSKGTGRWNTAVGGEAGQTATIAEGLAAVGFRALKATVTGSYSTAVGYEAGAAANVNYLTAVGYGAAGLTTSGAVTTALGTYALHDNTTGASNTACGGAALEHSTGAQNTALGAYAGDGHTTGDGNIFIGYNTDGSAATNANEIVIGTSATGAGSNTAVIGNGSVTDVYLGSSTPAANLRAAAIYGKRNVEAVTTTKAPAATESNEVYTNEGDADGATVTLPTAAAGLTFTVYIQTAQTLTVTANTGDTIRLGTQVTAAAGSITSDVVGSTVTLLAINADEWVATAIIGEWVL